MGTWNNITDIIILVFQKMLDNEVHAIWSSLYEVREPTRLIYDDEAGIMIALRS